MYRHHKGRLRSIPARAGEPGAPGARGRWLGVYPRACGGTDELHAPLPRGEGLSPRVRGNRGSGHRRSCRSGSIPARAGEPVGRRLSNKRQEVYPRACGGTFFWALEIAPSGGLSPRVRGNPAHATMPATSDRSIPARAGEPGLRRRRGRRRPVYPRACGGTVLDHPQPVVHCGLSPRVRGNPP